MNSRDKILSAVKSSQPEYVALPDITHFKTETVDVVADYIATLTSIGGRVIEVDDMEGVNNYILQNLNTGLRIATAIPELNSVAELITSDLIPHTLSDVDHAIINVQFGVAENGAVWVTEELTGNRVLPFICQHLMVVLHAKDIVATMHEAYDRIGNSIYGFGTFIAGPSKTADIEQSLVLGAHGPRSMTVFLLK
jgi:L-lactate dehydrogenase complex protein LldG